MQTVNVFFKKGKTDAIAECIKKSIEEDLNIKGIKELKIVNEFKLNIPLSEEQVQKIASLLLIDPITQEYSINLSEKIKADWVIEVEFFENVTDNVGDTAKEGIQDLLGKKLKEEESVRTAKKYLINGKLKEKEIKKIASSFLANELIEKYSIKKG